MKNYISSLILVLSFYSCLTAGAQDPKSGRGASLKSDLETLSKLNAQFIRNFINQDTIAHNQIIDKDFVCIEGNGVINKRDDYMKSWAHGYQNSHLSSFSYSDEVIRIFGNVALIRSRTIYTKNVNGSIVEGNSLYTDTYVKQNGRWWCVQAQITPVKKPS